MKLSETFRRKKWAIEFKEITSLADFDETFKKSYHNKKREEYSFVVVGFAQNKSTHLLIYGRAIEQPWFYIVDFKPEQKETNRGVPELWCKRIPFSKISEIFISDEEWGGQKDTGIIILYVLKYLVEKKTIDENSLSDFDIPSREEMNQFCQKWAREIGEERWGVWKEWKETPSESLPPPITENDLTFDEMNYALKNIEIPQEILD